MMFKVRVRVGFVTATSYIVHKVLVQIMCMYNYRINEVCALYSPRPSSDDGKGIVR